MEFDLENPVIALTEHLFTKESDHMPSQNYLRDLKAMKFDASVRQEAISFILQISCNCEPFVSYLAVNYLDRFLSIQGIPKRKQWILRLLAASCVCLATKMLKTEFALSVFQWEEGFMFDPETIRRMEVVILGALQWRMRSITPFSFFNFFTSLLPPKEDPPLLLSLKARASQFVFRSQNETNVLEFKPSIVAASALLCATHEQLHPSQFQCFKTAISDCSFVNSEDLMRCWHTVATMDGEDSPGFDPTVVSSSSTAVNVLDQQWWSSESTDEMIHGDREATAALDGEMKKRRETASSFCNGDSYQQRSHIHRC